METVPKLENNEQIPIVEFVYDRKKDIDCILRVGKGSQFSPSPTKVYRELIEEKGENPSTEQISLFIDSYLKENGLDVEECVKTYNLETRSILDTFKTRAESIFGIQIPKGTKAYLTTNSHLPYSINENWFYTQISSTPNSRVSMHELWHFYTWYKFGITDLKELGEQKYGDIKEALTVLLNPEGANLLPEGLHDNGYPQHKELRERILELWKEKQDIEFVWNSIKAE